MNTTWPFLPSSWLERNASIAFQSHFGSELCDENSARSALSGWFKWDKTESRRSNSRWNASWKLRLSWHPHCEFQRSSAESFGRERIVLELTKTSNSFDHTVSSGQGLELSYFCFSDYAFQCFRINKLSLVSINTRMVELRNILPTEKSSYRLPKFNCNAVHPVA